MFHPQVLFVEKWEDTIRKAGWVLQEKLLLSYYRE